MFDYEKAVNTIMARALGAPDEHGILVFMQLAPETRAAKSGEIVETIAAMPELRGRMTPGQSPADAAESLLIEWLDYAKTSRSDVFPRSVTMAKADGSRDMIVPEAAAALYDSFLKQFLDSGMVSVFFAPKVTVDINAITKPESLPLIYLWRSPAEGDRLMMTVNGAAIDRVIEGALARSHPHFQAVREWLVERLSAWGDLLLEHAGKRGVEVDQIPAWAGLRRLEHMRRRRALSARLAKKS